MKKLTIFLLFLISLNLVQASGFIENGRIYQELNLTNNEFNITRDYSFGLRGDDVTRKVSLTLDGGIKEIIKLEKTEFILLNNSYETTKLNIKVKEKGNYTGEIQVKFQDLEGKNGFVLVTPVYIKVVGEYKEKIYNKPIFWVFFGSILFLIIILSIIYLKKSKIKKKDINKENDIDFT